MYRYVEEYDTVEHMPNRHCLRVGCKTVWDGVYIVRRLYFIFHLFRGFAPFFFYLFFSGDGQKMGKK